MNSFLILLLSTISRGADEPRFVLIQPTYSVSGHGAVLDDLESRMPAQHPYRDRDRITWAHETTHGLNSYIRNRLGPRKQSLYVLEGRCVVLDEPSHIRLGDVARAVPQSERGQVYNLYLVQQQRDWDDTPTYVLDEWIAYVNGAKCGQELGLDYGSEVGFAREFTNYARALERIARSPEITAYVRWQESEVARLLPPRTVGSRVYVKPWRRR